MSSPALPDYSNTPLDLRKRPGIAAALAHGSILPPVEDNPAWQQRDLNEMVSRGIAQRFRQRPQDKAWTYCLTPAGEALARSKRSK